MRHLVRPFKATAEWLAQATETINALIRRVETPQDGDVRYSGGLEYYDAATETWTAVP